MKSELNLSHRKQKKTNQHDNKNERKKNEAKREDKLKILTLKCTHSN